MTILTLIVLADNNTTIVSNLIADEQRAAWSLWQDRKAKWSTMWDRLKTSSDLQTQINLIASTGNLAALLGIASAEITLMQTYFPTLFADCIPEASGAKQPNGQPYLKYGSPDRYWTVDNTQACGMLFGLPVVWATP